MCVPLLYAFFCTCDECFHQRAATVRTMNDHMAILFLLLIQSQRRKQAITFRQKLSAEGRKRRDRRISRAALQHPSMSTFSVLYGSGCDRSLITLTGLDHHAFRRLLEKFAPAFERFSPYCSEGMIRLLPLRSKKRGRPRSLSACQCLGLVLSWGRSRGSEMVLCLIFGITGSVCSLFLRFGRRILLQQLSADDMAAVRMPSDDEVNVFKHSFASKYSMLSDVYAVADGLKLYLQQSGDSVIQNMFYNGWTHDHYVGNVFVFAPNGTIKACAVNAPGAMHDSTIADWGNIYKKLQDVYDRTGGRCVVDSAFSKGNHPFLIKSSQDYLINAEHDPSRWVESNLELVHAQHERRRELFSQQQHRHP
ncbi:unnamed protein product [Chondrus crispus]|uniref:DDE Tnp4 domain-containing protein n=1 Tax=Chondrus crispus TaxID=2769 RepID=R7QH97_CHOCR|nr:unnamed protein product [Chondrus crispus]CDF36841.1 unnamed protein product [Chondrus crispus]|eukprot:XP_005716660.1 unnamed protein product [Chondrus crispus]